MTDIAGRRCDRCAYWARGYAGTDGIGGNHTDGTVSDCRRHAPVEIDRSRYPGANVIWPQTHRYDWCGDFLWDERALSQQGAR